MDVVIKKSVDDRMVKIMRRKRNGEIIDIGMMDGLDMKGDEKWIVMEKIGKMGNRIRKGWRENKSEEVLRRLEKDKLEVLEKENVENLIGLVEKDREKLRNIERIESNVVEKEERSEEEDMD